MRLNPDFSCCSSFVLSLVGKVTTGIQSFVSTIEKVVIVFALQITQSADQERVTVNLKLISGPSRVLQKLLSRYLNGTVNFIFKMLALSVLFMNLDL